MVLCVVWRLLAGGFFFLYLAVFYTSINYHCDRCARVTPPRLTNLLAKCMSNKGFAFRCVFLVSQWVYLISAYWTISSDSGLIGSVVKFPNGDGRRENLVFRPIVPIPFILLFFHIAEAKPHEHKERNEKGERVCESGDLNIMR